MDAPDTRTAALAAFDREHAWWNEALDAIGMDRMDEPGMMGEWSAKDLVAHLTAWQWKTVASVRTSLSGGQYPPTPWPAEFNDPSSWEEDGDVDAVNQWVHEMTATGTVEQVVTYSRDQWNRLRDLIHGLTVDQMNDSKLFPRLEGKSIADALSDGYMFGHLREHREENIEPWLEAHGRR